MSMGVVLIALIGVGRARLETGQHHFLVLDPGVEKAT